MTTKIEKYGRENDFASFQGAVLKKFPLFSMKHAVLRAVPLKKVCFGRENWKIEKSRGLIIFANQLSGA
jgi:hypothetical protein